MVCGGATPYGDQSALQMVASKMQVGGGGGTVCTAPAASDDTGRIPCTGWHQRSRHVARECVPLPAPSRVPALQETSDLTLPAAVPERIGRVIRACCCIDPRQRLRARALATVLESML